MIATFNARLLTKSDSKLWRPCFHWPQGLKSNHARDAAQFMSDDRPIHHPTEKTWPVWLSDLGMNKSPLPCICQFVFPIFCTGSHLTKVGTSSWRSVLNVIYGYIIFFWLVVWNIWIIFPIILGISSSQLTNSIIFQRGRAQPPTSH